MNVMMHDKNSEQQSVPTLPRLSSVFGIFLSDFWVVVGGGGVLLRWWLGI